LFYGERLRSVVAIQRKISGGVAPHGAGLFVSSGDRVYLVTCRHIFPKAILGDGFNGYPQNVCVFPGPLSLRLKAKGGTEFTDRPLEIFDSQKNRKWRSFLYEDRFWDLAVFELDLRELSAFDIRPWTEDEILTGEETLAPGTAISVLPYPQSGPSDSVPEDKAMEIESLENQIWASDLGGITTNPLYPGSSGSLVYRFAEDGKRSPEEQRRIQAVGIFTGAVPKIENPQGGHFHYIQTASAIIHAEKECLDELGISYRLPVDRF
jgi:hypothetical protein